MVSSWSFVMLTPFFNKLFLKGNFKAIFAINMDGDDRIFERIKLISFATCFNVYDDPLNVNVYIIVIDNNYNLSFETKKKQRSDSFPCFRDIELDTKRIERSSLSDQSIDDQINWLWIFDKTYMVIFDKMSTIFFMSNKCERVFVSGWNRINKLYDQEKLSTLLISPHHHSSIFDNDNDDDYQQQ